MERAISLDESTSRSGTAAQKGKRFDQQSYVIRSADLESAILDDESACKAAAATAAASIDVVPVK